ncbi:MAG: transporter substrate-binding domain-containing protein [Caldilineaceae bacterium]
MSNSNKTYILLLVLMTTLLCTSCMTYPQDPQHTLDNVLARGQLRVGVLRHDPWVTGQPPGQPGGVEGTLITAFADDLGVDVDWHWGGSEELFEALTHYELDVVIGGVTASNPWKQELGFTIPYYTSHVIVGLPPTGPMLTDVHNVTVAMRPMSGLEDSLEDRGAVPVSREDLAQSDGPIAAEAWEVTNLGFRPTEIRLRTIKHVIAVPPGENAWLMRLENFLLQPTSESQITNLLREAAKP